MRNLVFVAALALWGCKTATTTGAAPGAAMSTPATAAATTSMAALLNAQRAQNGLSPVTEHARLSASARAHAREMATNGYFSHRGLNGSTFDQRAARSGYTCARAENIAEGQRSEAAVVTAWMGSAGHRRNILRSNVSEFGIGRVNNVWVLVMGRGGC